MHYNTCDHGTVKRVVQLRSLNAEVEANPIASKIFVIIVIRDHGPTGMEKGRSFQKIGICSIIPAWLPIHGF